MKRKHNLPTWPIQLSPYESPLTCEFDTELTLIKNHQEKKVIYFADLNLNLQNQCHCTDWTNDIKYFIKISCFGISTCAINDYPPTNCKLKYENTKKENNVEIYYYYYDLFHTITPATIEAIVFRLKRSRNSTFWQQLPQSNIFWK